MAEPNPTIRGRRRGALIDLSRRRLRGAAGGRIAAVLTVLLVVGFAGVGVAIRVAGGGRAPIEELLEPAARWLAWLAGAPLALAAARDRRLADRRDGIDALAASRGFSERALTAARALGAMIEIAAAVGVPLVGLAVLFAALAGSARLALARLALAAGIAVFAIVAGVTVGGIAAACGRLGRGRGRWLLAAVVLGPWVLSGLAGSGAWSIPGALDAVLSFALRAGGVPA